MGFNVGVEGGLAVFLEVNFAAEDNLPGGVLVGYPGGCWEAIKPEYGNIDKVDDHLARKRCVGKVQNECAAAFFNGADETFDFTNVFACRSGVNLHHLAGIFDLVEFLIHHDDAEDNPVQAFSLTIFVKELLSCVAMHDGSCLAVPNHNFGESVVKKAIPLTNIMSAVSTTNRWRR